MRQHLGLAVLTAVLAAGIGPVGGTAWAGTPHDSAVVGHAYVNGNTVGPNTVAGFDRHADGSLTPIPGSPFVIGGAGAGSGLGSQERSRPVRTSASCWPSMPGAIRSLSCE